MSPCLNVNVSAQMKKLLMFSGVPTPHFDRMKLLKCFFHLCCRVRRQRPGPLPRVRRQGFWISLWSSFLRRMQGKMLISFPSALLLGGPSNIIHQFAMSPVARIRTKV